MRSWEKVFRTLGAVNCWRVNESESQEMWKLYVTEDSGVAIQSTFSALVNALGASIEKVYIGIMKYIDYGQDRFADCSGSSFGDFTTFFNYKGRSFQHENELRALITAIGTRSEPAQPLNAEGAKVRVDLAELLRGIYTASSRVDLLKKECLNHGLDVKVLSSAVVT
jgi:hypothetical protein